jgi:L-fuculose-phosphate aldolase
VTGESALRREIIAVARALSPADLGVNRSGNVSARFEDGLLITPTGAPYETLEPHHIAFVSLKDGAVRGPLAPSSETPFHRAIYRARTELNAIVHCHSPHATALACTDRGIPAFHYMVAAAGGTSILCAPYATFGSEALSDHAVAALADGRRACLLAHHGQIACGSDLARAFELAREVEALARQYLLALQAGPPALLDDAEMDRVLEKFRTYGATATTVGRS